MRTSRSTMRHHGGFTLIEAMVTVAIIGILASLALPAYSEYVYRSRLPAALDALQAYATRMEQHYSDTGNYGTAGCAMSLPTLSGFDVSCELAGAGQDFTATAVGKGASAGATYSIDAKGVRRTLAHPRGVPASACWSVRGQSCDG